MRKFTLLSIIALLVINCITVTADIKPKSNSISYYNQTSLNSDLPSWKVGDFWNYYIRLEGSPDVLTKVDAVIPNLNAEIVDENNSSFKIDIRGEIQGSVSTGEISGNFKDTSFEGYITIDKENLSVNNVEANILGRFTVALIPIPFNVNIDIECSPNYNSVKFPLSIGKEWQVSTSRINGFINVSAILDSIPVFLLAGGGTSQCVGMENITISSGTYESYKITTTMDINEIYYSPSVGNIIKMIGNTYDFDYILVELKNTNYIVPGAPKKPEKPTGETRGQKGTQYNYTTKSYDLENDDIFYLFDWDDGTFSDWLGPYDNNITVNTSHIWNSDGSFNVKVKAKDNNDHQSPWSDSLTVSMPKLNFYNSLIKIKAYPSIKIKAIMT